LVSVLGKKATERFGCNFSSSSMCSQVRWNIHTRFEAILEHRIYPFQLFCDVLGPLSVHFRGQYKQISRVREMCSTWLRQNGQRSCRTILQRGLLKPPGFLPRCWSRPKCSEQFQSQQLVRRHRSIRFGFSYLRYIVRHRIAYLSSPYFVVQETWGTLDGLCSVLLRES
jgi:hypothetical protein